MKKATSGPAKTVALINGAAEELEAVQTEQDEQWEEIEKLKKGRKRNFIVLENARLQTYRWRCEYMGPVPDV